MSFKTAREKSGLTQDEAARHQGLKDNTSPMRKGHAKTKPRAVVPQKRVFECPICGTRSPATKWRGRTKPGHIKTMYCYICKADTDHIQIE